MSEELSSHYFGKSPGKQIIRIIADINDRQPLWMDMSEGTTFATHFRMYNRHHLDMNKMGLFALQTADENITDEVEAWIAANGYTYPFNGPTKVHFKLTFL